MKNIIIFGASGNIGIYLVDYCDKYLNSKDYHIFACARKEIKTDCFKNVEYLNIDICNSDDYKKLPTKDVFAIVDLAGILPAYFSDFDPFKYIDVNIVGTMKIIEYGKKVNCDRIIYTQTWSDLAGYWGKQEVLKPDMQRKLKYTGDHAFYSITKCMIVDTLEYYWQEFKIKRFIFRLPNVYLYNPMSTYFVNGVEKKIAYRYMIERAEKGEPIELWGNPSAFKDILYVKDLCQMIYLSLVTNTCNGGIYNAGTGIKTSLQDQINGMIEVFSSEEKKSNIIYKPEKESFTSFVMDISNLKRDLNYAPKYLYLDYLKDYKLEKKNKRFDYLWRK